MLTVILIVYTYHLVWEQFCYDHNIGPELDQKWYTDKHGRRKRK